MKIRFFFFFTISFFILLMSCKNSTEILDDSKYLESKSKPSSSNLDTQLIKSIYIAKLRWNLSLFEYENERKWKYNGILFQKDSFNFFFQWIDDFIIYRNNELPDSVVSEKLKFPSDFNFITQSCKMDIFERVTLIYLIFNVLLNMESVNKDNQLMILEKLRSDSTNNLIVNTNPNFVSFFDDLMLSETTGLTNDLFPENFMVGINGYYLYNLDNNSVYYGIRLSEEGAIIKCYNSSSFEKLWF